MRKIITIFLISFLLVPTAFGATITKSIGTAKDYATIALWEADLDNAAVYAAGDTAVGEMYDQAYDETVIVINGGGTIGLTKVTLTAASGQQHDGTAGTGARIVPTAGGTINSILDTRAIAATNALEVSWIEINGNQKAVTTMITNNNASAGRIPNLRNLIIHSSSTTVNAFYAINAAARDINATNNIIYDLTTTGSNVRPAIGVGLDCDLAGGAFMNNTIYDIRAQATGAASYAKGLDHRTNDADCKVRNNIIMGTYSFNSTSTDFFFISTPLTLGTSTNNMSSDATADDGGGSGHLVSKTTANQFVSTTAGSEDLHIKTGSDAIDAGVDLVTTPTNVNIDINGYDRDAGGVVWDIGAHEFIATGGVTTPSVESDFIFYN